jgi:hypothetical protein
MKLPGRGKVGGRVKEAYEYEIAVLKQWKPNVHL